MIGPVRVAAAADVTSSSQRHVVDRAVTSPDASSVDVSTTEHDLARVASSARGRKRSKRVARPDAERAARRWRRGRACRRGRPAARRAARAPWPRRRARSSRLACRRRQKPSGIVYASLDVRRASSARLVDVGGQLAEDLVDPLARAHDSVGLELEHRRLFGRGPGGRSRPGARRGASPRPRAPRRPPPHPSERRTDHGAAEGRGRRRPR